MIVDLNIGNVVFNVVFEDLKKVDSEKGMDYILECILNCLKFSEISEFHKVSTYNHLFVNFQERI